MARTRTFTQFRREDFDAFKRLMPHDSMPDTFEQWREASLKQMSECAARGETVIPVIVDPKQFTAYCLASGLDYNFASMDACTGALARKQREGGK
jgi:hypothetical protein